MGAKAAHSLHKQKGAHLNTNEFQNSCHEKGRGSSQREKRMEGGEEEGAKTDLLPLEKPLKS